MSAAQITEQILRVRLIVIVRVATTEGALDAIDALEEAGAPIVEVSLATPGALEVISERTATSSRDTILGAGTVRTVADAEAAVEAGAAFLVSPGLDQRVVEWSSSNEILHIPGVLTPTEVSAGLAAGASLLKLFPAARFGPDYLRDLLAPFPEARLVPTGGVNHSNAAAFLDAGAAAIAVGSSLVGRTGLDDREQLSKALDRVRALTV